MKSRDLGFVIRDLSTPERLVEFVRSKRHFAYPAFFCNAGSLSPAFAHSAQAFSDAQTCGLQARRSTPNPESRIPC